MSESAPDDCPPITTGLVSMSCHVLIADLALVRHRLVSPDMLPSQLNFVASKLAAGASKGRMGMLREKVAMTLPSFGATE